MAKTASKTRRPRRWWRAIQALLAVVIVLVAGVIFLLATIPGGRMVALLANRLGTSATLLLEIDHVSGLLSGKTRVGHVLIKDPEGEPWLLLKGVEIDWSPLALFSSGLAIDRLSVERVELARLPAADPDAGKSGAFTLPLTIDVKQFVLPDILLGEEIAGRVSRIKAEGMARIDPGFADTAVKATLIRIDGVGGTVAVTAEINLPEDRFDLDFTLAEPAGGVLANLAGLSSDDAIAIAARSTGSLADWKLSITGDIDGERMAAADLAVQSTEAGHQFDLSVLGALGRFLPPQVSRLFDGNSEISLLGMVEPDRAGLQIDAFTLLSSALQADGRGRIGNTGEVSLKFGAETIDPATVIRLGTGASAAALRPGRIDLSVDGAADAARVEVLATVPALDTASVSADTITLSAEFPAFNLATRSGAGTVKATVEALGSANTIAARALAGTVRLGGQVGIEAGSILRLSDFKVSSDTASLGLNGTFDIQTGAATAAVSASVLSAVVSDALSKVVGDTLTASADLALLGDGAVSLDGLTITAETIAAEGSAGLDKDGALTANLTAALSDLSRLDARARGRVDLTAALSGVASSPDFDIRLSGDGVVLDGKVVDGLVFTATGKADPVAPIADVTLEGTYLGKPISGAARLASAGGRHRVDPLSLAIEGNTVEGALDLDGAFRPTGTVRLDFPDIGALSALALSAIEGAASGNLVFSVENGAPRLAVDLAATRLSGDGFSIADAKVQASVSNYLASPGVAGTASVTTLLLGKTNVSGIGANFSMEGGWTVFDINAQAEGMPVSADGRVRQAGGKTELELQSARVSIKGLPVALTAPARVSVANGITTIEKLTLSPGGGSVDVSGTASGQLAIAVRMTNLPLSVVDAFAPGTGLAGTVSGSADISGTTASPVITYTVTTSGFRAAGLSAVTSTPLSITANGRLKDNTVGFAARIADGAGLQLDADGSAALGGTRALSIRANGTAPLSLLSPMLAARGMVISGVAKVDLGVSGTLATPQASGTITTGDARFIDTGSGVTISGIAADIGLDAETIRIRSLTGALNGGGAISASGAIGISNGFPADLGIKVDRGRYADGKLVATNFDADLKLSGPLATQATLSGVISLDTTTISVPQTLPRSIAKLDVTHTNARPAVTAQAEQLAARSSGGGAGGGIGLDLRIEAPSRIFVRGRGIDAELGGSLALGGTSGAPVATGGFEVTRGRLSILGKRLDFSRGKLGFSGSSVPTLDFAATTPAGTGTATVLISGEATDPDISFTSSPSLPEDEVLALLVFGRSLSNLSPLQIAQLASAAAELTGVTQGGGLVERLRRATGIDDIDVKTEEDTGDTSVAVGKYLNDRTYIGIEQGSGAGSSKARIDLNIGRGVKLRGEASSGGETKGGIFFERDY